MLLPSKTNVTLRVFFLYFFLFLLCVVLLNACAPALKHTPSEEYMKKSSSLEQTGNITEAIEELKIALTIDPTNSSAKEQLKRLSEKRDQEAEKHYKAGLSIKESDPAGASREFITALRTKPDYQVVVDELKKQHLTMSESKLRSRVITKKDSMSRKRGEEGVEEEENYYLGIAISLYENGEYQAAIDELLKARSKYPRNSEISQYLNLYYYNLGILYYDKKDYTKALSTFSKVKKGFGKTEEYIKKTRAMLKNSADELYKAGLKFFRQQKLHEAIAKWNAVLEIEPNHQKAKEYIQRSKKLLEALKQ
jgi:tetratricopeptide (TPR) repeat protein